jgi:basic amino acid/polyamine antiporter, APA family
MKLTGLFATKPIAEYETEAVSEHLVRALGAPALVCFGIGAVIGTGIFVLTGIAAAQHAGPAIVLAFIIAGVGSMFAGLCYSEFSTMVPVAGSAYAYSYATLGEFIAWFVGWNLVLEYMMACAVVSVGWSRYLVQLLHDLGSNFPAALDSAPLQATGMGLQLERTGAFLNVPAVFIVGLTTALCYWGIKESAFVNNIIVAIKVSIVIAVIVFGAFYINPAHWHPFIPANTGSYGAFGWSGVLQASAIIFFAYIGFDAVSTVAQEAKDPARGMPIGLLGSLGICAVLYVLMSGVLTGLVPYARLNDAAPVVAALQAHPQLSWLRLWVELGALLGLTSVIITLIIPQARIWLTMSRDGLLPRLFGAVHPRFHTPHISTVITGIFAATFGGLLPIGLLGELVSIGTLIAFIVVCIGVLVLRYTRPELKRPFRVPWIWFVAPMGVAFCGVMAYSLPNETWWRLGLWSAIGFAIYFLWGYRHSRMRTLETSSEGSERVAQRG